MPERGVGEIGVLERSFNTMAGSLEQSREELAASRARIVAAGDQARRRIERDLHDGTQQRLVSLVLDLRAAGAVVPPEQPELRAQLARIADGLAGALEELRELSRGIHPAILSEGGLGPALKALARRSPVPVELEVDVPRGCPSRSRWRPTTSSPRRWPTRPSTPRRRWPRSRSQARGGRLHLAVRDDGVGGATPGRRLRARRPRRPGRRAGRDDQGRQPCRAGDQSPDRPADPPWRPPFRLAGTARCRPARRPDGRWPGRPRAAPASSSSAEASRTAQLERSPNVRALPRHPAQPQQSPSSSSPRPPPPPPWPRNRPLGPRAASSSLPSPTPPSKETT